jgi:hypothetical protein
MEDEYQRSRPSRKRLSPPIFVVAAIVLIGLSFFGALAYLKHSNKNNGNQANTAYEGSGSTRSGNSSSGGQYYLGSGNGNTSPTPSQSGSSSCGSGQPTVMLQIDGQQVQSCGAPIQGQVSAVNSSSITVQPSSGSSQTLSITSSTKVIKQDQSAGTPSDISVGDTAVVIASGSDPSQAAYILINPNLSAQ